MEHAQAKKIHLDLELVLAHCRRGSIERHPACASCEISGGCADAGSWFLVALATAVLTLGQDRTVSCADFPQQHNIPNSDHKGRKTMRLATASFCTNHTSSPSASTPPLQSGSEQENWDLWSGGRLIPSRSCKAERASNDAALSDVCATPDALQHAGVGVLGAL